MDCWLNVSNNPPESVTLLDCALRGLMPNAGSTVPTSSSSTNVSNRLSSATAQRDPSLGQDVQEQKPKDGTTHKDNLALLDESIADLNRTSFFENSDIQAPDTFAFKMEQFSSGDKSNYNFSSYSQRENDEAGNERLIEDNTLDILQSLELPGTLLELTEFCETDDAAFLPSLDVADALREDTKPILLAKNINGNGNVHPQQTVENNLNVHVVKTEKDTDFIQLCTPGVIKQENERSGYCQISAMPGHHGGSVTVSMDRQPYHYGVSTSLPDQKPVIGLNVHLPAVNVGWLQGHAYGNTLEMQKSESVPHPCMSTYTYNSQHFKLNAKHAVW